MPRTNHSHPAPAAAFLSEALDAVRAELADLAFVLESRRRLDAADVAMALYARIGELRDELAPFTEQTHSPEGGAHR